MKLRHPLLVLPLVCTLAALAGCATNAAPHTAEEAGGGHGAIKGAEEAAEPPLALVSIDATGSTAMLDLLNEQSEALGEQGAPLALTSDGRYGFATTKTGVAIIDSGRWTWDHVDHFHYYRAEARQLGTVAGKGTATISTGMLSTAGGTALYFAGSGEAVLLDNSALAEGRITETFRIHLGSDGAVAAPLGDGALLSHGNELVWHNPDGSESDLSIVCTEPSGSITTRVALVVGCAEGAVIASSGNSTAEHGNDPTLELLPYPTGTNAPRAYDFEARKGRPTVAALAGDAGFWLLNTREQSWNFIASEVPLVRVTAIDDAEGHVLALDERGRVLVYLASSGELVGATDELLPEVTPNISISVDDQRAYLNDPSTGSVYEIAYAGEVRVARTLHTATTPFWLMEVGR